MKFRLAAGMIVGGRFQVESVLGAGDIGEVYRVVDPKTRLAHALKLFTSQAMLEPSVGAAFESTSREVQALGDEFIGVQELGMDPHGPFATSAEVSIPSLEKYVEQFGALTPEELGELFASLAPALTRAHAQGIVHNNLSPRNLFYGAGLRGKTIRITDFGVTFLRKAEPRPWPFAYGWGAPELVGGAPPQPTADIYALGLLAYYALVGRPIYTSLRLPEPAPERLWEEMHTLPAASERAASMGGFIAPSLDEVFARALAPDPAQRYQSVDEFSVELKRATHLAMIEFAGQPGPVSFRPDRLVAPPPMVNQVPLVAQGGTQVLTSEEVERARAELDALVASRQASAPAAAPAMAQPPAPLVAPPPFISGEAAAPPAIVSAPYIQPETAASYTRPAQPPGGRRRKKTQGVEDADAAHAFALPVEIPQPNLAPPPGLGHGSVSSDNYPSGNYPSPQPPPPPLVSEPPMANQAPSLVQPPPTTSPPHPVALPAEALSGPPNPNRGAAPDFIPPANTELALASTAALSPAPRAGLGAYPEPELGIPPNAPRYDTELEQAGLGVSRGAMGALIGGILVLFIIAILVIVWVFRADEPAPTSSLIGAPGISRALEPGASFTAQQGPALFELRGARV